jgi:hypothetical protein
MWRKTCLFNCVTYNYTLKLETTLVVFSYKMGQFHEKWVYHIHRCKKWFSRSDGFCYDPASNLLASVGNSRNGWAIVGMRLSQHDMPMDYCRSRIVIKSTGCGISGKVPWHIELWRPQNNMPQTTARRSRDKAKSTESGELVFTSMDVVLYGLSLLDGRFLNRKKSPRPLV